MRMILGYVEGRRNKSGWNSWGILLIIALICHN